MTREDIIRMAREAGAAAGKPTPDAREIIFSQCMDVERFAALVASHVLVEPCCGNYDQCQKICMPRAASAEREACAKVCDHMASRCNDIRAAALESAAENIRSRGNT